MQKKRSAQPSNIPSHIVGIGASAGGLEAIETFFKNMSPTSGLAFVVIQHLSPDYKSLMVELLTKKTEMPVHRAEDGMEVLSGNVYLIPPKKNLSIFHGKLLLNDKAVNQGINLPIDIFLRSLAEDQGEQAIAIILSGTGSDGTRGVRAIKEMGGMVMVQNEESAKFDGMPKAAAENGGRTCAEGMTALAVAPYFGSHLGLSRNAPTVAAWTEQSDGGLLSLFQELARSDVLNAPGGLALPAVWRPSRPFSKTCRPPAAWPLWSFSTCRRTIKA